MPDFLLDSPQYVSLIRGWRDPIRVAGHVIPDSRVQSHITSVRRVRRRPGGAPGPRTAQRIGSSRMGKLSTLPNCGTKLQPVGAVSQERMARAR